MKAFCHGTHRLITQDRMTEIRKMKHTAQGCLHSMEIICGNLSYPFCCLAMILTAHLVSEITDIYSHRA